MIRKLLSVIALIAGMTFVASPAFAHTDEFLSVPENGSTVTTVDALTFTFSEEVLVDPEHPEYGPEVVLTNADGISVELGTPTFDVTGATMTVPILTGALPDGDYTSAYRVTSIDSHPVEGSITFVVEGSDAPALAAASGGAEAVVTSAEEVGPTARDAAVSYTSAQTDANAITLSIILSLAGTVLLVWAVIVVIRRRKK